VRLPNQRARTVFPAVLVGIAFLPGCQHFRPPASADGFGTGRPAVTKLTDRQAADVQVAMGRMMEKRGDGAQAAAAYVEALKHDADRPDACLRLAILYDQAGQFAQAQELYEKALKGQPGSPDIYCDRGYSLYLQHRWPEAEMNLRQAIALAPEHERAHNNLGLVLAHLGRSQDALAEFRRAGCSEADAHINLAYALTLENRLPDARLHYQSALAADASSAPARQALRELDQLVAKVEDKPGQGMEPDTETR
jgi:Flp pilus assembly protein TadD